MSIILESTPNLKFEEERGRKEETKSGQIVRIKSSETYGLPPVTVKERQRGKEERYTTKIKQELPYSAPGFQGCPSSYTICFL